MSSSTTPKPNEASNTTAASTTEQQQQQQNALPSLGALDEDDEFEEFEEQDWPESATDLSQFGATSSNNAAATVGQSVGLTMGSFTTSSASSTHPAGSAAAAAAAGAGAGAGANASAANGDHLWQDSWDDDTVEDDFSKALRAELEKQNGAQAMST